jgi:hypothetical protein
MDKIRDDSNNSKYSLGVLHWSFPLEMEFMNKKHYLQITRLSSTEKEKTHKKFFIERAQTNDSVKTFLHYVLPINSNMWDEMLLNSYNFILKDINENNYNEFLERVIRTIDIYGTGIAFMYILNKTLHLIEPKLVLELRTLFYNMINPNVFMRYMPEQVLNEFEKILLENGILSKYGKHFENHILISNENVNIAKVNEIIIAANNIDISIDEEKVNRISNSTPTKINRISSIKKALNTCPDGKERNPLTRRCVNVCKYGYIRNANFKCVRDKTIKLTRTRKAPKPIVQNPLLFFR